MRNLRILDKASLAKLKAKHLNAKITEHKDQAGIEYTRIETPDGRVTYHHHKESVSRNIAKYRVQYLPINHTIKTPAQEAHHVEEIPAEIENVETVETPEEKESTEEPAEEVAPEESEEEQIAEGEQISGEVTTEEGVTEELEPVATENEESAEEAPTEEVAEESEVVTTESEESEKEKSTEDGSEESTPTEEVEDTKPKKRKRN